MDSRKFHVIKPEIRVLGVDDGFFTPHVEGLVPIVGVVFRGGYWLDGVMYTEVRVDGFDATEKIVSMVLDSPHYKQLRVIVLDGITFAGFNVVDIRKLNTETKLPVIAVTLEKPNLEKVRRALKNLAEWEKRWDTILNAGKMYEVSPRSEGENVYAHFSGILEGDAKKILKLTSTRSNVPEALRVAHIIASGMRRP